MFSFFKKPQIQGTEAKFLIKGMHCTSCSLAIDGTLEDMPGVFEATTNYAHAETRVNFDPQLVEPDDLIAAVKTLGYEAELTVT